MVRLTEIARGVGKFTDGVIKAPRAVYDSQRAWLGKEINRDYMDDTSLVQLAGLCIGVVPIAVVECAILTVPLAYLLNSF